METVSAADKVEAIQFLQSAISKSEKALVQMTQKGANTALVKKRLKALSIGLAILENVWNQKPHPYTKADAAAAREVLVGLLPSIRASYANLKAGSPQRTLVERRIKSLELAIQALDELPEA